MSNEKLIFELTTEETERYFAWARQLTEAHVDEGCEPPGPTFTFECWLGFRNAKVEYCGLEYVIREEF